MPIKISNSLPAKTTLESENIFVMTEERALMQDIRPLKIIILNLMPKKIETETQILRLLGNSSLQVDIELLQAATHIPKNTPPEHLLNFYKTFDQIKNDKYDGMIVTGAPVEQLKFEDVDYWDELCKIIEWSKTNVYATFYICWGAQAALYYHYGINKVALKEKMFGIFPHKVLKPKHQIVRGFDEIFFVPQSRHTGIDPKDIEACDDLEIVATSDISGPYIIASKTHHRFFITGHSEYDRNTLANEYFRDLKKGLPIKCPYNYFPDNNPQNRPKFIWRSHANLLYTNWLNYFVYQQTPYDLNDIKETM